MKKEGKYCSICHNPTYFLILNIKSYKTKWEQSMEQNDEKPCFIFPNHVLFADSDYTQKLHLWII